jgi:hypothetical protein
MASAMIRAKQKVTRRTDLSILFVPHRLRSETEPQGLPLSIEQIQRQSQQIVRETEQAFRRHQVCFETEHNAAMLSGPTESKYGLVF